MRIPARHAAAAAVAVFLLSSCWHPPFDPDLSASQHFVSSLGSPVWSSELDVQDYYEGGFYLPSRRPEYYSLGVWVRRDSNSLLLRGMSVAVEGGSLEPYGMEQHFYDEYGPAATLLPPIAAPGIFAVGTHRNEFDNGGLRYFDGMNTFQIFDSTFDRLVGFGTAPFDEFNDMVTVMQWPTGNPNPAVVFPIFDGTGLPLFTGGFYELSVDPPPRPTGPVFAAYVPATEYLYYSHKGSSGAVETYRWKYESATIDFPYAPEKLPVSRQLTGILSDGRLLADTGSELRVYSSAGASLFTIPTGTYVRFAYESVRNNGVDPAYWVSVFVRTVPIGSSKEEERVRIEIYEVRTSELADLAD